MAGMRGNQIKRVLQSFCNDKSIFNNSVLNLADKYCELEGESCQACYALPGTHQTHCIARISVASDVSVNACVLALQWSLHHHIIQLALRYVM